MNWQTVFYVALFGGSFMMFCPFGCLMMWCLHADYKRREITRLRGLTELAIVWLLCMAFAGAIAFSGEYYK